MVEYHDGEMVECRYGEMVEWTLSSCDGEMVKWFFKPIGVESKVGWLIEIFEMVSIVTWLTLR